jgi:hypothetical protein
MSGNIATNNVLKALSVLSAHCPGCLQVIQNKMLERRFLVSGT